MLTENEARKFATHWIQAWNSRDIDEIMSHYDPNVVLVSPVAAKILSDPSGTVKGKEALRKYFRRGLEAYPNLKFELVDVLVTDGQPRIKGAHARPDCSPVCPYPATRPFPLFLDASVERTLHPEPWAVQDVRVTHRALAR